MNLRLLLPLLPLALSAVALATPEKPVIVSARLHCLSLAEPLDRLALYESADKQTPIAVPNSYLSPVYDYHGPANAIIVHTRPAPPPDAAPPKADAKTPPPDVAASFKLPPQGGEFLLLFAPGPNNCLRVAPFDFSPEAVPSGHYLVWNISTQRIAFSFGDTKLFIEPGQSQLMTPHAEDDTYVPLRVYDEYNGKSRLIVSGRHFNRANARQIFLFSASTNPSAPIRMKMQAITDLLPPPAPPAAPVVGRQPSANRSVAVVR